MRIHLGLFALVLAACSGTTGPAGKDGQPGQQGPAGPAGANAEAGAQAPIVGIVPRLDLPASAPYPNSVAASADGSIYVGGLFGQIVKFSPTSTKAITVVPQVGKPGTVLANIAIDGKTLWACGDFFNGTKENPFANPNATLYAFDLDGKILASYPLPNQGSSLCEDIAVGPSGVVYVTDPFLGSVDVLANNVMTTWATSALFTANFQNPVPPFGVHGIAVTADNAFVTNFSTSALVRIPIQKNGTADVANIVPEKAMLANPEHVMAMDDDHLLISEDVWCGGGRLTALSRMKDGSWTNTVLHNGIVGATGFAAANNSYYTVNSQVCAIVTQLAGGPTANPILPFWIDRIDAD